MKKYRNSMILIPILTILVITGFLFLTVNFSFIGKKSIHADAKTYKTRHCLIFYPDSAQGVQFAKDLCDGVKDDRIFDYTLIPYGDYYLINYGNENRYFADQNFDPVFIETISDEGKRRVVDYLRYYFKKEEPEKYYNADFIKKLNYENINFDEVTYDIEGDNITAYIPAFDVTVPIPLKFMQKEIGMDFGFPNEIYRKPVYLDPDPSHPLVALTFDDGPMFKYEITDCSSETIVDLLASYDACGTFYVIGDMMENRETWADYQVYAFLKKSINAGNEYGSHTQTHLYALDDLSGKERIRSEIEGPAEYMKDFIGYEMKTYRPVQGIFDQEVLEATQIPAILWDVDSEDWLTRDPEEIVAQVLKYDYESGDVILFHDIYDETGEALEKIVPELINRGCQLVTVSDIFRFYGIEDYSIDYYYSINYYE